MVPRRSWTQMDSLHKPSGLTLSPARVASTAAIAPIASSRGLIPHPPQKSRARNTPPKNAYKATVSAAIF
jgi:hypothetical protein